MESLFISLSTILDLNDTLKLNSILPMNFLAEILFLHQQTPWQFSIRGTKHKTCLFILVQPCTRTQKYKKKMRDDYHDTFIQFKERVVTARKIEFSL